MGAIMAAPSMKLAKRAAAVRFRLASEQRTGECGEERREKREKRREEGPVNNPEPKQRARQPWLAR